jgi:hypothetical protein
MDLHSFFHAVEAITKADCEVEFSNDFIHHTITVKSGGYCVERKILQCELMSMGRDNGVWLDSIFNEFKAQAANFF